jgi:hypothetical protein
VRVRRSNGYLSLRRGCSPVKLFRGLAKSTIPRTPHFGHVDCMACPTSSQRTGLSGWQCKQTQKDVLRTAVILTFYFRGYPRPCTDRAFRRYFLWLVEPNMLNV